MIIVEIFKSWFLHPEGIVIMHFCIKSMLLYTLLCVFTMLFLMCRLRSGFTSLKTGSEVTDLST